MVGIEPQGQNRGLGRPRRVETKENEKKCGMWRSHILTMKPGGRCKGRPRRGTASRNGHEWVAGQLLKKIWARGRVSCAGISGGYKAWVCGRLGTPPHLPTQGISYNLPARDWEMAELSAQEPSQELTGSGCKSWFHNFLTVILNKWFIFPQFQFPNMSNGYHTISYYLSLLRKALPALF